MKKTYRSIALVTLLVVIQALFIVTCTSRKSPSLIRVNPAFREYVAAFTAGVVSTHASVKVRLSEDFADSANFGMPLEKSYFTIRPAIAGKCFWSDSRTLEFRPDEPMPQNQVYTVEFALSQLIRVPDSLKTMVFQFQTMQQRVEVEALNHKAYANADLGNEFLSGSLTTADLAPDSLVEKVLRATQSGRELPVAWLHEGAKRQHTFQVDSIRRGATAGEVILTWNGGPIDAQSEGEKRVVIPALGDFSFLGTRLFTTGERCLMVQFSDPLKSDQNLDGLFSLGSYHDLRYTIEDNLLWIYLPDTQEKKLRLTLEPGIRNLNRTELGKRIPEEVLIEGTGPNVRFAGDGNIMPASTGMLLPFEAVNLRAVDIKVVRVFETNILQFLQVNDLNSTSELVRVGRVVLKKTMPLTAITDYSKWNRFSIDLSALMKTEPGAIYAVSLSFRPGYSALTCMAADSLAKPVTDMVVVEDPEADNEKEWAYYGDYFNDDYDNGGWRNYHWEERNDPCKASYYFNKTITKNILASDLGIIAKAGNDGTWHLFVTDLVTTKPLKGVAVEFFNFQLRAMGQSVTDGDGMAVVPLKKRPFVVVARQGSQKGYLKLAEGTALSMSMFDVSGEPVQKGIKGFIYGERGVWRPGDSLFLTFILEDKTKQLPANHPVNFSLYNPNGQLVVRQIRNSSVGGFYNFSTATAPEAPTGNWLAKVNIGAAEFRKNIKIETVKPNRLKITLNFVTDKLVKDRVPTVMLGAAWLTGSVARNLRAKVTLTLTKAATAFPKYPGYVFENPAAGFSAENVTLFDGRLDENGNAKIVPAIRVKSAAPGVLKASFETMVFEDGGDFSIDRFTMPYYPFTSYAGLSIPQASQGDRVLSTDKDYPIALVNVDPDGNLVPANRLKVAVFKLNWRWWWDNSESGYADFISTSDLHPVDSMVIATSAGRGVYTFRVGYEDWGRYLIKVTDKTSGHSAARVVYADWPGYYRMPGGEKQAAAMLTITANKEKYKVGDKVKLTIPSSPDGRALLTLETGSAILKSFWTPTRQGTTEITFEVTPNMAPNCYASITLIQPHSQTKNDLPIRLYGVLPVVVEDPATHLKPVIGVAGSFSPGKKESITVKEAGGKAMTYTLAVVDDGLLDLTRFKTPDPWLTFYAREALGVKSWDLFDQVMGAFTGELQRILSIGGDEEGALKGSLKANRFRPMVRCFGPFELKAGETRTHLFVMPQYIGSVRVMVVAGRDGAYGANEKTVPVKKPLMVLATLPRVVGPGETLKLPVSVFSMDKKIGNVKVELLVNELFGIAGERTRQVAFTAPGDKLVTFDLMVQEATGIGKVTIVATSGNERAEHTIELNVRNPNLPVTDVLEKAIRPGASWTFVYQPAGIPGTNAGTLELSSILPLNLEKRLGFLIHYPYGCLEQTTSAVFPQLYLSSLMELPEARKQEAEKNIRAGIRQIRGFQLANGGLSYWPGSAYADDWGTCYAGHFMLEAEQRGYSLPVGFLSTWKEFQRQKAISWVFNQGYFNDDLTQAYRLYTLALAKAPETGAMNRLLETKNLSVAARWMLASAYQLAGRKEVAMQLVASATLQIAPYRELSDTYGSDLRDKAIIADALSLLGMLTKAAPLVKEISAALCSNEWYSTQSTAWALMAVSRFTGGTTVAGLMAKYQCNGGAVEEVASAKPLVTAAIDVKPGKKGSVQVTAAGKGILYARLIITGIPAYGDTSRASNNLKIAVQYKSLKGQVINPRKLEQGTNFVAEVTVTNPGLRGEYRQLALNEVFPSGWEVINARSSDLAQAVTERSAFDNQDVRDDRVYTWFSLKPNQSKTFRVMLMATYQGRFYQPATACEAMYDNTIGARVPGGWVEVVPPVK